MAVSKEQKQRYDQKVKEASPNSKSWIDTPLAFLIGGAICTLCQGNEAEEC